MFQISGLFKFWYSFFVFSKWSTGTYNPGTFNCISGINSSPAKKMFVISCMLSKYYNSLLLLAV